MSDTNTKPITMQADEDEVVDVDKLMAEFDKESNTRHFSGIFDKIIKIAMVLFSLYAMFDGWFGTMEERQKMSWFIGIIVFIAFIIYPVHKKEKKKLNRVPFYDYIFAVAGAGSFFYYAINCDAIVDRASRINEFDIAVAIIGTVLLFEACRRVVGLPIVCVSAAFIAYAFIIRGVDFLSIRTIMHKLFYTTDGIAGTPLNVCASFIVLFIIFASFLEQSGIGTFFVDLANSIAGKSTGGPAKVAVISSAMEGMYSGSSVANTVGSGSVTIPTMKRCGYKPEFAAAVEAAASTGGQIMPPIMGAAAFLMTEYTGMPYAQIAIAAILPAVLYFMGIFMMIHFEAKKLGLKGLPKEAIPNFFKLIISKGYLLLPVIALVISMNYYTPAKSAIIAILIAIAVKLVEGVVKSIAHKKFEFEFSLYFRSLANGTKNAIGVALACAVAGCISSMVQFTGLANVLSSLVQSASQIHPIFALLLTMIMCIILGMGVPTTANYVIMASMVAPILLDNLNITMLAAHMFVFYFGIVADITPPVALAAYAGSAIAKSNPMKTGVTATRLAITAFIVPYIFVFSPEMLIIGSDVPWYEIVLLVITAIFGIIMVSAGMEGYFLKKMPWWQRIIALAGGLCMVIPGWETDAAGVALIVLLVVIQSFTGKKKKIILSVVSVVIILGIIAGALAMCFTRYHKDENDTEEFYMQNVGSAGYENTIETAYPQTDLYGIIEEHFRSVLPEGKTEKKVVIIGYDGCRADILTERNDEGAVSYLLENGASNNLTYCGGVNYPAQNTQDTSTAPGWCSIVTGTWADVNGITGNGITKSVEPKTLMTSLVEDGTIDSSAFITKWKGHFTNDDSTYKAEKEYCEENNINVDFELRKNKKDIHTGAMEEITSTDCADFVFIVYEDTDSAGHDFGFSYNNPVYKEGFNTEDAYGYEVIKAIEARETYETEDWLIIVTSDHGGFGTGHGGSSIQERMTFVVMNKEWN